MLNKFIKFAKSMGMDVEELMQMTVLEAILKIEETKKMWTELREDIK